MNENLKKMITYQNQINKIRFFDILVKDIHKHGDKYETIDSSKQLTYHEVWEWISKGGDWNFKVTEHNNPENVFLVGSSYQNMNSARKGTENLVIGHATNEEIEEIHENLFQKRKKEYGMS